MWQWELAHLLPKYQRMNPYIPHCWVWVESCAIVPEFGAHFNTLWAWKKTFYVNCRLTLFGSFVHQGKKLPPNIDENAEEGDVSDEDSADEMEDDCKLMNGDVCILFVWSLMCTRPEARFVSWTVNCTCIPDGKQCWAFSPVSPFSSLCLSPILLSALFASVSVFPCGHLFSCPTLLSSCLSLLLLFNCCLLLSKWKVLYEQLILNHFRNLTQSCCHTFSSCLWKLKEVGSKPLCIFRMLHRMCKDCLSGTNQVLEVRCV